MVGPQNIFEKIYFSVVTFSTLGYGDISPLGWVKAVASIQALSGPITVGFFIYGYGRHIQARENVKRETHERIKREKLVLSNFDIVQYYRKDVFHTCTHFLSSLKLEYISAFAQWHVCFLYSETPSMETLKTHYYSFPRISFLVERHIENLRSEYLDKHSTRPVHHAQTLIDYHIASVQSLIMRGGQYVGIDKELFERLTSQIRDGSALHARAKIIKDCEAHGEPVDKLVLSFFNALENYLEHVIFSMKILTLAPSVSVVSSTMVHSVSVSIEERHEFPKYQSDATRDQINSRDWMAWSR